MDSKDIARFWSHVDQNPDGCWEWQKSVSSTGYGQLRVKRKTLHVHRIAYTLAKGAIPDGLFVCHHCDNRRCVRPDHLFLGTVKDNAQDAKRKGRLVFSFGDRSGMRTHPERHPTRLYPDQMCGESAHRAKLTWELVHEIRAKREANKTTYKKLAQEYNVSYTTIEQIIRNERWVVAHGVTPND